MKLTYQIDQEDCSVHTEADATFTSGKPIILAYEYQDLAMEQAWGEAGYTIVNFESLFTIQDVQRDITEILRGIIIDLAPQTDLTSFTLETYHRFVDDELHYKVIQKTRRLYPKDFGLDEQKMVGFLGDGLNAHLGYFNPVTQMNQWIIVRINRPNSLGYNPVHKDIYESYDSLGKIPRMINVWIPICGVEGRTGLPIVPGSHLVAEDQIQRTTAGSTIEGQRYSVNCIQSWNGETVMQTMTPNYGEMLVFSSHLIHGLAQNYHEDTTRISLEFRLYEQPHDSLDD